MHLAASIDGTRITATPHTPATCPTCDAPVRAKCGSINAWHWSHVSLHDCDTWTEPDSAWHHWWQSHFAEDQVEVVRRTNNLCHRADAVSLDGTVIEFQHSSLSTEEIQARETFWGKMIWVFDAGEPHRANRLWTTPRASDDGHTYWTFKWQHPRRSLVACTRPIYLDLSDGLLLHIRKLYPDNFRGWGHLLSRSEFLIQHAGGFTVHNTGIITYVR